MKKRGQVTVFIVLGIIIFVVVGLLLFLAPSSLRKETPLKELSVEEQVSEIRTYIASCLEDSLKNAVSYCSGNFPGSGSKCDPYEEKLANRIEDNLCTCIPNCNDFSIFKNIKVEAKGDLNVKAKLSEDQKKITVTMQYPIEIKKEEKTYLLGIEGSPFSAQYFLEQSDCMPIRLENDDYALCKADENKVAEVLGLILEYNKGDKVAMGGTCIACKK